MITALERLTPGHAACTAGVIPSHIPRRLNCKHRQRHTGIALSLAFFDWHQEYTKREPFPAPIVFVYPRAVRASFQTNNQLFLEQWGEARQKDGLRAGSASLIGDFSLYKQGENPMERSPLDPYIDLKQKTSAGGRDFNEENNES